MLWEIFPVLNYCHSFFKGYFICSDACRNSSIATSHNDHSTIPSLLSLQFPPDFNAPKELIDTTCVIAGLPTAYRRGSFVLRDTTTNKQRPTKFLWTLNQTSPEKNHTRINHRRQEISISTKLRFQILFNKYPFICLFIATFLLITTKAPHNLKSHTLLSSSEIVNNFHRVPESFVSVPDLRCCTNHLVWPETSSFEEITRDYRKKRDLWNLCQGATFRRFKTSEWK